MARDSPQPHSHSGPGDGGDVLRGVDSLDLDQLDLGADSGATGYGDLGLLSGAGFSDGDILPVFTITPFDRDFTTTSTTYATQASFFQAFTPFDDIVGDTPTAYGRLSTRIDVGTDETADAKVLENGNGDTIAEITGITTTQGVSSGWQEITFTNRSDIGNILFALRTNPGSNSSTLRGAIAQIGVEL